MNSALYVVLGLSVLVDLALGAWASAAWGSFVDAWHLGEAAKTGVPQLLGMVLGLCLFCFAALQGLAMYWIRSEKEEGHRLTILFGGYLIVSSLVTFLVFRRAEFLLIDGLRGALLTVLAVVVLNAPATVRELRLPEKAQRESPSPQDLAGRDRYRGRREGGERGRRDRRPSGRPEREGGRIESGRPAGPRRGSERDRERGRPREGEEAGPKRRPEDRGRSERRDRPDTREHLRPLVRPIIEPSEARRVENRSRPPEELTSQDPLLPRRPRPGELESRPLTVVVKGGPSDFRIRPLDDPEISAEAEPLPGSGPEAGGRPILDDRRRRHRRRRPRGGPLVEGTADTARLGLDDAPEEETDQEIRRPERRDAYPGGNQERADRPGVEPAPREDRGEPVVRRFEGAGGPLSSMGPEDRQSGPPPSSVEALDMLSLLDPHSKSSREEDEPFGRTRRPVRRRGALPPREPEKPDHENRASENAARSVPGPRTGPPPVEDSGYTPSHEKTDQAWDEEGTPDRGEDT